MGQLPSAPSFIFDKARDKVGCPACSNRRPQFAGGMTAIEFFMVRFTVVVCNTRVNSTLVCKRQKAPRSALKLIS